MSARLLRDAFFGKLPVTADGYQVISVASKFESGAKARMPVEFEILFAQDPAYREEIEKLLDLGYVIEIHRLVRIPQEVQNAVESIARMSQEGTVGPWVARLLQEGDRPTFTEREVEAAKRRGVSLYEEVERIFAQRYAYKRIALRDPQQIGIDAFQQAFFLRLNDSLSSHILEYGKRRILAETSLPQAASWIQSFLLFFCAGLFVQMLGSWVGMLAYVSTLVIGGVWEEGIEVWALRRAGYTGRQVFRRAAGLAGYFVVASGAAWFVQMLVEQGRFGLGGFIFGLAVSILPIRFFLRALHGFRERFLSLQQAGKLRPFERVGWSLAWKEYAFHPAKIAALVTVGVIPFLSFLFFSAFPTFVHNGWLLVFLLLLELFVTKIAIMVFSVWPYVGGRGYRQFSA
ncbi:hypothetical protein KBD61_03495 [Patescibacteria group bacterium]|nr:hypothetical protein [Patescibacteria group bacterium]MBP9710061.1 hypothetical protein [Patescibacteria group bacterium]